jgi:alkylhydroperoxidase family enzyme
VDAHSAMVMAQGFTQDQVKGIIADIDGSTLVDDKTKMLLHFSEKITRHAYKVAELDIQSLRDGGCTEGEIFEAIAVTALFNFMDRMADALGAPVEGFQEMVAGMMDGNPPD